MERRALYHSWHIGYETKGVGDPTLVLVHGASSDRGFWRSVADRLASDVSVVALDRLGHGSSDGPESGYSMDAHADAVMAVLDHAGVARAVLIGHSNGAPVVRQAYRRHPKRVLGLVLLDGALMGGPPAAVTAWMRDILSRDDYATRMEDLANRMPTGSLPPDEGAALRRVAASVPRHVMLGELESIDDTSLWEPDPIAVPLLVVRTEGPDATPDERAYVGQLNPAAQYEVWSEVSHFFPIEDPERLVSRLLDFTAALR